MLHIPSQDHALASDQLSGHHTLAWPKPQGWRPSLLLALKEGRWRLPLALFLAAFVVFSIGAWERVRGPSTDPHFVWLANTYNVMIASPWSEEAAARRADKVPFELDRAPLHRNDWASYHELTLASGELVRGIWLGRGQEGRFQLLGKRGEMRLAREDIAQSRQRYFISFPPGPAFLMMPLAAIWGYGVNDVLFTIFFAALNVALMFVLLRRLSEGGRTGRSLSDNLWLTALMGFGTAHLWCAVLGQVWFTALIVGVTFTLLYILCAMDARHPLWAGVFLAMAFATRTPLLYTAVFFYAFVFFPGGRLLRRDQWGWALQKLILFSLPCLVMGLGLMWMNQVRFESLGEFGHRYLAAGGLARIQQYGLFDLHFLSKNLTAALTLLPRVISEYPYVQISRHGMSLLLTTPAWIYLFRPQARESTPDRFWWRLAWLTVAVVALPGLLYQNTGYEQFGFRFSLDYTPYLVLILALGRRPLSPVFKACVVAGMGVNAFGAVTFKRFDQFYADFFV